MIQQESKKRPVRKHDPKKGVAFKMGFRNHKDPLYYDSKTSDRVFIPDVVMSVIIYLFYLINRNYLKNRN